MKSFQIFEKFSDFREIFRFLKSFQIFEKFSDFWKIFRFSENVQIFGKCSDFWKIFRFLETNSDFRKNFRFSIFVLKILKKIKNLNFFQKSENFPYVRIIIYSDFGMSGQYVSGIVFYRTICRADNFKSGQFVGQSSNG